MDNINPSISPQDLDNRFRSFSLALAIPLLLLHICVAILMWRYTPSIDYLVTAIFGEGASLPPLATFLIAIGGWMPLVALVLAAWVFLYSRLPYHRGHTALLISALLSASVLILAIYAFSFITLWLDLIPSLDKPR